MLLPARTSSAVGPGIAAGFITWLMLVALVAGFFALRLFSTHPLGPAVWRRTVLAPPSDFVVAVIPTATSGVDRVGLASIDELGDGAPAVSGRVDLARGGPALVTSALELGSQLVGETSIDSARYVGSLCVSGHAVARGSGGELSHALELWDGMGNRWAMEYTSGAGWVRPEVMRVRYDSPAFMFAAIYMIGGAVLATVPAVVVGLVVGAGVKVWRRRAE